MVKRYHELIFKLDDLAYKRKQMRREIRRLNDIIAKHDKNEALDHAKDRYKELQE